MLSLLSTAYAAENTTLYVNLKEGIQLEYLPGGEVKDGVGGSVAMFVSPKLSSYDFRETVILAAEKLPEPAPSPEKYLFSKIEDLKASKNFKIYESKPVTLAKLPAYKIVYTATQEKSTFKAMQVCVFKDGRAYLFTYAAGLDGYNKFLLGADKIIQSFEFTK